MVMRLPAINILANTKITPFPAAAAACDGRRSRQARITRARYRAGERAEGLKSLGASGDEKLQWKERGRRGRKVGNKRVEKNLDRGGVRARHREGGP